MMTTRRLRGSATPSAVGTASARLPRDMARMSSALLAERIVELIAADRVRVPHDEHIGHRATRNFGQDPVDCAPGLFGELVPALDEIEGERRCPRRLMTE